jgi:RNA polymerase sigma factor (TIGR02999 family)
LFKRFRHRHASFQENVVPDLKGAKLASTGSKQIFSLQNRVSPLYLALGEREDADVTASESNDSRDLLKAWQSGDTGAGDRLFVLLYSELRQISAAVLRGEGNASLSTGDLVNEAVLRLIKLERIEWTGKAHFLALAARAMRQVLVDHARKKKAGKRGHQRVTLITNVVNQLPQRIELDALEKALVRLSVIDKKKAEIVEMRYFGGLPIEDISKVTGDSESTVKRHWRVARAWLIDAMQTSASDEFGVA